MTDTKDTIVIDGVTYQRVGSDSNLRTLINEIYEVDYVKDDVDSDDDPVTHVEFTNGADIEYCINEYDTSSVNITINGWSFDDDTLRGLIKVLELIMGELS